MDLYFNHQVQQRGQTPCFDFVVGHSGKKVGVGRVLCFNLLAHGHVMSVKGIRRYHQTNLSVTPAAMLRSTLHRLPAARRLSAAVLVIRGLEGGPGQEPTRQHSREISSTCLLWVYFFSFLSCQASARVVLIVAASDGVWKVVTDVLGWFVHCTHMQEM